MKIFTFEQFQDQFDKFYALYDASRIIIENDDSQSQLKGYPESACRYCQLAMPATTFKQDAHIISQLLGNNKLICDYECDQCNKVFSK